MREEHNRRTWWILATLMMLLFTSAAVASEAAWRQLEDPAEAGWSHEKLEAARSIAEEVGSASVMVVENGVVVAAWGQIDRPFPIYSMRKGLYNALVGMLVGKGRINLDATLRELGVDELDGLTDVERTATVEQILSSRSGVYHVSAYEPSSMKRNRPQRGSHRPGEHWFYNNWDFNLVAYLIEKASGRDLGSLFRDRIAKPLGMEDFSNDDAFSFFEPSRSQFPAVIFRMSARDLARVGQWYLQDGVWNGKHLLDEKWIRASWTPRTTFETGSLYGEGNGFGYLWWIYPARKDGETPFSRHDVFLTRGSDGQILAIVPAMHLVIVHQTDTETGTDARFEDAVRLMDAVIAAKSPRTKDHSSATVALSPKPLTNARPAPERRKAVAWGEGEIDAITGQYSLSPKVSFIVHQLDGRVFALPKGIPLAEVELFVDSKDTIFSPAVDLTLQIIRSEDGRPLALEGRMQGRPVRIERILSGE